MATLELYFYGICPALGVVRCRYSSGVLHHCVRGKNPGAYQRAQSFQWTRGVQAFSLLVINALVLEKLSRSDMPHLMGGTGSPAASLHYSLGKQPAWLMDVFGCDSSGRAKAKSIILRTRTGGPIALKLNPLIIPPEKISIYWEDTLKSDVTELQKIIESIEKTFNCSKKESLAA